MKSVFSVVYILLLLMVGPKLRAYTNLTPAEVQARLTAGHTLLLLDVREVQEYVSGHIAEPAGQLPLTPVNMPWSSGVLSAEYQRLPQWIDILVYCRSGGRSAAASAFLEDKGFNRIFNMNGGFSSWPYAARDAGYGDHSGKWVRTSDIGPVIITCTETGDTSKIIISPGALSGVDSMYVELQFASGRLPNPPEVPLSDVKGLFRVTALDRFGLSRFSGDSLVLADTVYFRLFPEYPPDMTIDPAEEPLKVFIPERGWRTRLSSVDEKFYLHQNTILRRWYNLEAFHSTGITARPQLNSFAQTVQVFPNPFNRSVRIITPPNASVFIFDVCGRLITELDAPVWSPQATTGTGIYFIHVQYAGKHLTRQVVYLK